MKANRFAHDRQAVTPVIGTIIILGISVLGIAGIMLWGAPTLQRIQEENAKQAMLGEFQEIRRDSLVLSITDSSRIPRVSLDGGTLAIEDGTRMQISANHDPGQTNCDFHVYDWGGTTSHIAHFTNSNCKNVKNPDSGACSGTDRCLWVYQVTGSNTIQRDYTMPSNGEIVLSNTAHDFSRGDWLFTLADSSGDNVIAQAWLISTQAITWELGGVSDQKVWLEGGAIFSSRDRAIFLEERPAITEEAFGTADFVMRIPTYSGESAIFSGRSTPSVFLGLVGNHLRVTEDEVYSLRFDFEGAFAEAWCHTLLARNSDLRDGTYAEHATYPCQQSDISAHRSVQYTSTANTGGDFPFEFIHARITTNLA